MNDQSTLTQPFEYSNDLQLTLENDLWTIRKLYKFRGLYIAGTLIMFATLVFFTGLVAVMGIQENQPSYIWIVLLFLVFVLGAFSLLKSALFSKEILVINLNKKIITFHKNRKKTYQYRFDEIIQWQLVGKVFRQYRGGPGVISKLYLRLKDEPPKHKPIEIFIFHSSLDLRTSLTASVKELLPLMKASAQKNGQEVAERLQNATQIPWRWYEYNNEY